jgi:hypothetical protein
MAMGSKISEKNIKLHTEKDKIFYTASILLRGVVGGLEGLYAALGDLEGYGLPWGVAYSRRELRVASEGQEKPLGL